MKHDGDGTRYFKVEKDAMEVIYGMLRSMMIFSMWKNKLINENLVI